MSWLNDYKSSQDRYQEEQRILRDTMHLEKITLLGLFLDIIEKKKLYKVKEYSIQLYYNNRYYMNINMNI